MVAAKTTPFFVVTLGVLARRVGDGLHSPRHLHLPTSKATSGGTTTCVSSASVAAVRGDGSVPDGLFVKPKRVRTGLASGALRRTPSLAGGGGQRGRGESATTGAMAFPHY